MKLIIASNNKKKIEELKTILGDFFDDIISLKEAGIDHETIEDGNTFTENALKKAREIACISGCASVADDSGLEVDALEGAPGIYSARYAGEHGDDKANNKLLLENMKDVSDKERTARFKSVVALVLPDGRELSAEGAVEGIILHEEKGDKGFGYDPLFFVPSLNATFAQVEAKDKHEISHRGKAVRALAAKLDGFLK